MKYFEHSIGCSISYNKFSKIKKNTIEISEIKFNEEKSKIKIINKYNKIKVSVFNKQETISKYYNTKLKKKFKELSVDYNNTIILIPKENIDKNNVFKKSFLFEFLKIRKTKNSINMISSGAHHKYSIHSGCSQKNIYYKHEFVCETEIGLNVFKNLELKKNVGTIIITERKYYEDNFNIAKFFGYEVSQEKAQYNISIYSKYKTPSQNDLFLLYQELYDVLQHSNSFLQFTLSRKLEDYNNNNLKIQTL